MTTLAIIPARAGSTRLKDKNLQSLDASLTTLIDHAVNTALEVVDAVVISTDYSRSHVSTTKQNVFYHRRPEELCGPDVDLAQVIANAVDWINAPFDTIVTLQPATPLRSPKLIREMLDTMRRSRCVAAITMARCVPWSWRLEAGAASNTWSPSPYPRSQDVRYHNLQEINTVQIATRDVALSGKRWDLPLLITELPAWAILDIDTQHDLDECRQLWPTLKPAFDQLSGFPFHIVHSVNGSQEVA